MNQKGKVFSLIAVSGAMLFSFAIIGKNFDFSSVRALDNTDPITDSLVFSEKPKAVSGISRRYSSKGKTNRGQTLYLISDYASGENPGNSLMFLNEQYDNKDVNWYVSEFENGQNKGVDSIYKFQAINSISFDMNSTIKGAYWNAKTAADFDTDGTALTLTTASSTLIPGKSGKTMKFKMRGYLGDVTVSSISFNYTCDPSGELDEVDYLVLGGTYGTEFTVGDEFNHDGLQVTAVYDSGKEEDVTDAVSISEPDMTTSGTKNVVVSYAGATTTYQITVNPGLTVVGLRLVNTRVFDNINFLINDEFSFRGIVVYAIYSDDSEADVTSRATASGYDMSRAGTYYLTVSFGGYNKNDAYYISVEEINNLTYVAGDGAKTTYSVNETFDPTGFTINANMKSGNAWDVTSEATFDVPTFDEPGNYNVEVSYEIFTVNIPVVVTSGETPSLNGTYKNDAGSLYLTFNSDGTGLYSYNPGYSPLSMHIKWSVDSVTNAITIDNWPQAGDDSYTSFSSRLFAEGTSKNETGVYNPSDDTFTLKTYTMWGTTTNRSFYKQS